MTPEQKALVDSYKWWHRIPLSDDYTTPGICPHGNSSDFESRFGFLKDFSGKSVLDVGTYDGLFAFEAEKRGAGHITAIDLYQYSNDPIIANQPFQLAKEVLKSNIIFRFDTLEIYNYTTISSELMYNRFDYILHYGILYHIKNPLQHVEMLMNLANDGGTILLETAISKTTTVPSLEYRPGFDEDPTNYFYPNKEWVELAFKENGAKSVECFYNDGIRATFRIQK